MNRLIYILGKRSKRVRLWYHKKTDGGWLWGLVRFIEECSRLVPVCEELILQAPEGLFKKPDAPTLAEYMTNTKSWSFMAKEMKWFDKG